jgi:A/G-specific adenine glycosylase
VSCCKAHRRGIASELPRKAPKRVRPTRHGAAYWIERPDGAVLLRRRPDKGLLGGMIEVPSSDWTVSGPTDVAAEAPLRARWRDLGRTIEHTFTHFHLVLTLWRAEACEFELPAGGYRWVAPEAFHGQALPSLMRKVVAEARGGRAIKAR